MHIECLCGTHPNRLYLWTPCKPRHACAVKPEVLKSWSLEIDYSRAPCLGVVQSLKSPFFPPHIGAEPGLAKEESSVESSITCMRMLKTPPFFPLNRGKKPYLEVFSRFGLWRDFLNDKIQATISAFRLIKNMSINPKSVEFYQCHAKPHSICFLSQYQR